MGIIPVVKALYPDELLYSWIFRLAKANGMKPESFTSAYMDNISTKAKYLPYDVRKWFVSFYKSLDLNIDMAELYLKTSIYSYESIAMKEWQQMVYINNIFYRKDEFNSPVKSLFNTIRICPKCIIEDRKKYGEGYFHRSHQLSGIDTCYKHGVILMQYQGKTGCAISYDMDQYQELELPVNMDTANNKSKFSHDLLNANIRTNFLIFKQLYDGKIIDRYSNKTGDILDGLMEICDGDISKLKNILLDQSFDIPKEYELLSSMDFPVQSYKHLVCGKIFVTTNYGLNHGWKCPYCLQRETIDSRYKNIIEDVGKGEYIPLDEFQNVGKKINLYHKKCGRKISVLCRAFIYEGTRCLCESTVTFDEAKKLVSEKGEFELLEYKNTDEPCRIYAKVCGHTFSARYRKFINSPYCRICFPKRMTTEYLKERIRNTTNGEYELVSEFVNQNTKIKILHHLCGKITEYGMRYYHMGAKCPFCTGHYVDQWNKMFRLLLDYKEEFGNVDIPKRENYKGERLGLWCNQRRKEYKEKKATMTPEKIKQLEEIGFVFDPLEKEWIRRFEQYKRYTEEHGNPYISRRTDYEGEHLGAWVETQRKRYQEGKLSEERQLKLLQVNPLLFSQDCVKEAIKHHPVYKSNKIVN